MIRFQNLAFGLVLVAIVSGGVGCGLPKQWHDLANKMPEATPQDPAYQMLCIWEPAEGVGPDNLPTRGFAGKITFFTRRQATGVRVKGDVRVAVFDDQSPIAERGKPIHQWDFRGDAWAIHLQDSSTGPSYSVFIPYSRKGNHQAQCALQVLFTPENGGQPLYSDTVAVLLPGPLAKKEDQPLNAGKAETKNSLQSITIPLKEKRNSELEHLPLNRTERTHTVAPVSDLYATPALRTTAKAPVSSDTFPQVMETLPQAPPSYTPLVMPPQSLDADQSAQPIVPASPTANAIFSSGRTAQPAPSHPLIGHGFEAGEASNPFNR